MFENKILNELWREVERSAYIDNTVKEEVRALVDHIDLLNPLPEEKQPEKKLIITDEVMRIIAVRIDPAFYDIELDGADNSKKDFLQKLKLILEDIFEKPDIDKEAVLNNAIKEMNKSVKAFEGVVNRMKYEMGKIIYKADDPWDERAVNPGFAQRAERIEKHHCCGNCNPIPKLLDQAQQFNEPYDVNDTFPPQETGTEIIK